MSVAEQESGARRRTAGPHDDVHHVSRGEHKPLPHDRSRLGEREGGVVIITGCVPLQERGTPGIPIPNLYHIIPHQVNLHSLIKIKTLCTPPTYINHEIHVHALKFL